MYHTIIFSLLSPEPRRPKSLLLEDLPNLMGRDPDLPSVKSASPLSPNTTLTFLPELEEIRVSPCIAKKGYLNVLEERSKTWKRR